MIGENALVIYKNKPALVKEKADGKYSIVLADGEKVKVRDKDIELIHPGPVKNFSEIEGSRAEESAIREAWELLLDEQGAPLTIKDFSSFIYNEYKPSAVYSAFCLLRDGIYFSGTVDAITVRSREEVEAEITKRETLQRETGERAQFLEYLKKCIKKSVNDDACVPDELKSKWVGFMQDVEALAYGKSEKSRTLRDLGIGETPEDAHWLLLKTGFWTTAVNPHPSRFGLSFSNAQAVPDAPDAKDREDLCRLSSFAIDNSWSHDPDDAVSLETTEDGKNILYVHIADPASTIAFDSPAEKEGRDRGATLYLPECTVRMLAEETLPMFALGLSEKSCALTFKLNISDKGEVTNTEIFPSIVKVRRLTYEGADIEMEKDTPDGIKLREIYDLSQKIFARRVLNGAVNIELPDVHIVSDNGNVTIEQEKACRSSSLVRECMISAGEGTATWAASRGLAFPYISQEVEMQSDLSGVTGYAGSMQLRRCMRPRILSVKPGRHQGLGLETYTQVTSPLRRYTDLLAHMEIRAFLRGDKPFPADEISSRLGYGEAAAVATVHAERASNNHWIMVYLSGKKDSVWEAVAIENKGNRWSLLIPSLAMETQAALSGKVSPNNNIKLILKSVNIAKGEAVFVQAQ